VLFIVIAVIVFVSVTAFFGVTNYYGDNRLVYIKGAGDIRWGIDIQGGVEAVYTPNVSNMKDVTNTQMDTVTGVIKQRLLNNNITDAQVYTDYANHQVIVQFPWKSDETNFDPQTAVQEIGSTGVVAFLTGQPSAYTESDVILKGSEDIQSATVAPATSGSGYEVQLSLTSGGTGKFAAATAQLAPTRGVISIWVDQSMISAPTVNDVITGGNAVITGGTAGFTLQQAQALAANINSGAMPFGMTVDNSQLQIISPTLGRSSLQVMLLAGLIAFAAVTILMIWRYRMPGVIAVIALVGHMGLLIASVSGYFPGVASFTLTVPGIAGIILSIGMGVDANVLTSERIREELREGKTLDGSIDAGFHHSWSAIWDGNFTVVIVAIVLMGAFGPPDSSLAKIIMPFLFFTKSAITGTIYSFGYTLLVGVICNLLMGVTASRLMLKGATRFKPFRELSLFGGEFRA